MALPLALAFGVASGLGPLAGLYGSIFCGFFAAVLGGTPAQITGPTGPMTVVTAAIVARFAALGQKELVFSVVILAVRCSHFAMGTTGHSDNQCIL